MRTVTIKISIITVVYNASKTIESCINSILSQSYKPLEIIVIDGASDDGTLNIIESYKEFIDILISEPDLGIYDAINKGIAYATGDIIGLLHSDDFFAYDHALRDIALKFNNSRVEAVYGDLEYVNRDNYLKVVRYWKSCSYSKTLIKKGWMPPHPTLYLKSSVYRRLGKYNIAYKISADYDLILRFLFVAQIHSVYIPKVIVKMRLGGLSNKSFLSLLNKSLEDYRILRVYKAGGIKTLLNKNLLGLSQFWQRAKK